jgi:hypothetical protein
MATHSDTRTDTVVLIFSTMAVLIAATLSMATISTNHDDIIYDTLDPLEKAEAAANAGVDAARWHIECHGRTEAGGLTPKYFVNGATYTVEWDDVDLADSTVNVRSTGDFTRGDDKHYEIQVESRIKIEFMPSHNQEILKDYYSQK